MPYAGASSSLWRSARLSISQRTCSLRLTSANWPQPGGAGGIAGSVLTVLALGILKRLPGGFHFGYKRVSVFGKLLSLKGGDLGSKLRFPAGQVSLERFQARLALGVHLLLQDFCSLLSPSIAARLLPRAACCRIFLSAAMSAESADLRTLRPLRAAVMRLALTMRSQAASSAFMARSTVAMSATFGLASGLGSGRRAISALTAAAAIVTSLAPSALACFSRLAALA